MSRSKATSGLRAAVWILLAALALAAPAGAKVRLGKFSGQIVSVSKLGMKVRGANSYEVLEFTFDRKVSAEVAKRLARGRIGVGQPIQVKFVPGKMIAVHIKR